MNVSVCRPLSPSGLAGVNSMRLTSPALETKLRNVAQVFLVAASLGFHWVFCSWKLETLYPVRSRSYAVPKAYLALVRLRFETKRKSLPALPHHMANLLRGLAWWDLFWIPILSFRIIILSQLYDIPVFHKLASVASAKLLIKMLNRWGQRQALQQDTGDASPGCCGSFN